MSKRKQSRRKTLENRNETRSLAEVKKVYKTPELERLGDLQSLTKSAIEKGYGDILGVGIGVNLGHIT